MAVDRHGYVGLVRIEGGLLNIAAVLAPDFVKRAGGPPQALAAVLAEAGFPAITSLADADWHGTLPLTRRTSSTASRRVLVMGDAAGYVEPFTGEGMAGPLPLPSQRPRLLSAGFRNGMRRSNATGRRRFATSSSTDSAGAAGWRGG